MPSRRGRIVLLGLVVLLAVSLGRTVYVEQQKRSLAHEYTKATALVDQLQGEYRQVTDQLVDARHTVEGQASRISNLEHELQEVDAQLNDTEAELAALEREHDELRKDHATMASQYEAIAEEKRRLEARLSSLKELRLAIKDVKQQIWNQRWAAVRAYFAARRQVDQDLAAGNRGYLVRHGASTVRAPSQLQVHVLEPEPQ